MKRGWSEHPEPDRLADSGGRGCVRGGPVRRAPPRCSDDGDGDVDGDVDGDGDGDVDGDFDVKRVGTFLL